MDPETIKELIEAFTALGGEAKEAFVWYLVLSYLPGFLLGIGWTVIGGLGIFAVLRLIRYGINCDSANEKLKVAAGMDNHIWHSGGIYQACQVLREHYKKE